MKFSVRQILASAIGAVCAAVVASVFGVKGTIVGVAIGSAAATTATALVAQSIERGHQAVKQVAVRAPESSTLLRRLGGTDTSGPSASSVDAASAPTEMVGQSDPKGGGEAGTPTQRVDLPPTSAGVPATQRLGATAAPVQSAPFRGATPLRFSWRTIAGSAAVVFVLALLFITAVELISGKPLSTIFGGADTGTSVKNLFSPAPSSPTTPTTTSTTTPTSTSTTSTTTSTSTTATTGIASTTTTAPSASSTTTTGPTLNGTTTSTSSP